MKLDQFLIGLLIVSAGLISFILFAGEMNANYSTMNGTNASTDAFENSSQKIYDTYQITQEMKNTTLGTELSADDPLSAAYEGSFQAIRLIKNSFSVVGTMVVDAAAILHVPSYFVVLLFAGITIAVIFALIYLVWRPA